MSAIIATSAPPKNNYTFTVDKEVDFVYIVHMKDKSLLILKAAKTLLRLRSKAAGTYAFYASPAMCLYGPHGGVSYWGDYWDLETACQQHGLQFVRYDDAADSGLVLAMAKKLANRYERFCEQVNQWREIGQMNYADNSVESVQQNRFGAIREVMLTAPSGDRCF